MSEAKAKQFYGDPAFNGPPDDDYCPDCGVNKTRGFPCKDTCQEPKFATGPSNTSGLEPVGKAVLCLPYDPEVKSSIIVVPENVKRQLDMVEMRVMVIAIGPDAWLNDATGVRETPRAKVGDKVLVSKFCGALCRGPLDDVQYRMINGRDIWAKITGELGSVRSTESSRKGFPEGE